MDSEIDIVAENGKYSHGGISLNPVTIVAIKVEYGARVSEEFMTASEEAQILGHGGAMTTSAVVLSEDSHIM